MLRFNQLKKSPSAICRKKMYKSGKNWVVASTLAFAVGSAIMLAPNITVTAATTNQNDSAATTNQNDSAATTNQNDSAANTNQNDSAVNANQNDSAVNTNQNDSAVNANQNDSAVNTNQNDSAVNTNQNDSIVNIHQNDSAVDTNQSDSIQVQPLSIVSTNNTTFNNETILKQGTYGTSQYYLTKNNDTYTSSDGFQTIPGATLYFLDGTMGSSIDDYNNLLKNLGYKGRTLNGTTVYGIGSLDELELMSSNLNYIITKIDTSQAKNSVNLTSNASNTFNNTDNKLMNLRNSDNAFQAVTSFDTSKLNMSNVTNASGLFSKFNKLTSLDLSNVNANNLTNTSNMFNESTLSLNSLASNPNRLYDLSGLNMNNVTDLSGMFAYVKAHISGLQSITNKAKNLDSMFLNSNVLSNIDLSNWDTSNVVDFSCMFEHASNLKNNTLDLSNFNMKNVDKSTNLSILNNVIASDLILNSNIYIPATNNTSRPVVITPDNNVSSSQINNAMWVNIGNGTKNNPQGNYFFNYKNIDNNSIGSNLNLSTIYNGSSNIKDVQHYIVSPTGTINVPVLYHSNLGNISNNITGDIDTSMSTPAPAKDGYEITPNTTTVTINRDATTSTEPDTLTYTQTAPIINSYTITQNYVDTDGKQIAAPDIASVKENTVYTARAKALNGYVVNGSANQVMNITQNEDVTFKYEPIAVDYGLINVSNINKKNDSEIGLTQQHVEKIGSEFTTEAVNIAGFDLDDEKVKTVDNVAALNSLFFSFLPIEPSQPSNINVITTYVDEDGNKIADPDTKELAKGSSYTETANSITGYSVIGDSTQSAENLQANTFLTFIYKKDEIPTPIEQHTVTVSYVDEDGNKVADPASESVDDDTSYTAVAKAIDGYKVVGDATQTIDNVSKDMNITFTYKKTDAPVEKRTATINYVDEDGNKIADSTTEEITIGAPFKATAKTIDGYEITGNNVQVIDNVTNDLNITFTYKKTAKPTPKPTPNPDNNNNGGGSGHKLDITYQNQTFTTFPDRGYVSLYNIYAGRNKAEKSLVRNRALASDTNWFSDQTTTVDGELYARVATHEWAKVSQLYKYTYHYGVVETKNYVSYLVDSHNDRVKNRALAADTAWRVDKIAYLGDRETPYYRVATNEFLSIDDGTFVVR